MFRSANFLPTVAEQHQTFRTHQLRLASPLTMLPRVVSEARTSRWLCCRLHLVDIEKQRPARKQYDGEFAEVKTFGIDGIVNGLWLGIMQIHRAKIEYTPDEFRERYPVGMVLQIVTTTEIRPVSQSLLPSPCQLR
jgi:hypothetical protein